MALLTLPLATLVLISDIAIALFALLLLAGLFSKTASGFKGRLLAKIGKYALPFAFTVAVVSTLGSLYFSEIAGFEPCRLCWFQRIFMYPQAVLLGIALLKKDKGIFSYAIPLSIIGGSISAYNYWIQVMPVAATAACSVTGPSCASSPFFSYGYITIAFMALTGFVLITIAGLVSRRAAKQ